MTQDSACIPASLPPLWEGAWAAGAVSTALLLLFITQVSFHTQMCTGELSFLKEASGPAFKGSPTGIWKNMVGGRWVLCPGHPGVSSGPGWAEAQPGLGSPHFEAPLGSALLCSLRGQKIKVWERPPSSQLNDKPMPGELGLTNWVSGLFLKATPSA